MTAHLVERIGGDPLRVTLGELQLQLSDVGPLSITHGRDSADGPVEPGRCTLTVETAPLARLPRVGDELRVELTDAALTWAQLPPARWPAARVRFTGHVTDVAARAERRGTPPTVTITAATRRSRLGRTVVGDAPWPVEDDGARAARILALAAPVVGAPVGLVDEGTVQVTARDVDRQPALQLLDELALHTNGQLVELRNGELRWHDALHRRRAAVDVELTAANVLAQLVATQRLAGIVNRLSVAYGPPVEGGERPAVEYADPTSETMHGPFGAQLGTQLQNQADALSFARLLVGRRSRPAWVLDQLDVELTRTVDPAVAGQLLALEHADLVRVVGFPADPFDQARLWVEGWTETVTRYSWGLELAVSDYGRSGVEPRWVDVNPDVSWAETDPLTWLQVVGWDSGEFVSGRWVDVPVDERWSTYSTEPTWATAS